MSSTHATHARHATHRVVLRVYPQQRDGDLLHVVRRAGCVVVRRLHEQLLTEQQLLALIRRGAPLPRRPQRRKAPLPHGCGLLPHLFVPTAEALSCNGVASGGGGGGGGGCGGGGGGGGSSGGDGGGGGAARVGGDAIDDVDDARERNAEDNNNSFYSRNYSNNGKAPDDSEDERKDALGTFRPAVGAGDR